MGVAAVEEATAGMRGGLDEFAEALRWYARSLEEFGAEVRPLEMFVGGDKEVVSSWSSRRSEMLKTCLKGWGCSWCVGECFWMVELCFGASGQGGGEVVGCGKWVLSGLEEDGRGCGIQAPCLATWILHAY